MISLEESASISIILIYSFKAALLGCFVIDMGVGRYVRLVIHLDLKIGLNFSSNWCIIGCTKRVFLLIKHKTWAIMCRVEDHELLHKSLTLPGVPNVSF